VRNWGFFLCTCSIAVMIYPDYASKGGSNFSSDVCSDISAELRPSTHKATPNMARKRRHLCFFCCIYPHLEL
jgi:hypothetical protein